MQNPAGQRHYILKKIWGGIAPPGPTDSSTMMDQGFHKKHIK